MTSIVEIVTQTIEPVIQAPYELVDVEYGKMGGDYVLSIFIDKEGGISLQDTADLSELISPLLDTIQPDPFPDQYMLEVTSPGLERPLKTAAALEQAVGKYIHVKLYQAIDKVKIFEGTLQSFDGEQLELEYLDKTRKKQVTIPYSTVAKARLAVKI
ncbi:ribosome maturation factor RimP [Streptococcus suis]|uniref:ribosome maturation factor RimP n=1 Tax=Streptococcus suis TaxID=1307 RepID=UPI001ABDC8FB|nr:ribosome maturation factor RimP [Streptococcus suis]